MEVQREPAFACLRCWKLKKKCDRSFPKCSRCKLIEAGCVYSNQPPTDRSDALRSRVAKIVPLFTPLISIYAHGRNLPLTSSSDIILSSASQEPMRQKLLPVVNIQWAFEDFLFAQLHDAFNALRHELKDTCNTFLDTINTSLPIVIDAQLRGHVVNLDQIMETDIRLLLLSIYLVTKMPVKLPGGGTDTDWLYSVIKPFYADFNSTRSLSNSIIQAGLFIAIYEQGQALDEAAYLTIGVCARMGQVMGLHKSLQETIPSDPAARELLETRKHIWWALIWLDRILTLESNEPKRPLATKHPSLDNYLPSFYGRDAGKLLPIGRIDDANSKFPEIIFTPANSYARSCQATYLLSYVFIHIADGTKGSSERQAEAKYLDKTVQDFSLFIIEQSNREVDMPWNYSCAGYMICMIALCALHQHHLFLDSYNCQSSQEEQDFAQTSRLALDSFARSAIDGAKLKLTEARDSPPFTLHFFREMAVVTLKMGYEEGKEAQHLLTEISSLRNYLSVASEKWTVAGRHLHEIDDAAAQMYGEHTLGY